jgi:hypothetical protein
MLERQLIERVEALERQNRALRRWVAAFCVVAGSLVWMAQAPASPEIRARKFVLVNESGAVAGELAVNAGMPMLTLRDSNGRPMVQLTGDGARASMRYRDINGEIQDLAAPTGVKPLSRVR